MDLNFNEMCRLCARKCEAMQNIFQDIPAETEIYVDVTKELSTMLAFKISNATSIKVFKENCRSIAVTLDVSTCSNQRAAYGCGTLCACMGPHQGGCIAKFVSEKF